MKPSELRGKNGDELQKELEGLLRAQFGLRMQVATQQLSNTSQLKKVKRDIARVRTVMKEKAQSDDQRRRNQRTLVGRVTSNKMQKTVVVRVERRVRDPLMGKTITRSRKYHAHVEEGQFGEGDLVEIAECRPISRTKSWRVTRLVEKSKAV